MKKGFTRLRGLAAAGAVGLAGLVGGGTARAANTAIPLTVTRGAIWSNIDNNASFPSSSDVTTTNGAVYPSLATPSASTGIPAFGISDAVLGGAGDAFDNALILAVDGTLFVNPDGNVDLTGDTVTSDTIAIVAGVNAQVQYFFAPTRPVVRALFSLTNTTAAPISVDPVILSDYGSDDDTTIRATSDGDTVIENTDMWYISDDNNVSPDPRITTTRFGSGATVVPLNALTLDGAPPAVAVSGLRYPVTIQPGQTVRILVFMELSDPAVAEAGAIADAADFESLTALQTAGLLTGISTQEQGEIINYGSAVAIPVFAPVAALGLFGLLGGIGFFELRRRKS